MSKNLVDIYVVNNGETSIMGSGSVRIDRTLSGYELKLVDESGVVISSSPVNENFEYTCGEESYLDSALLKTQYCINFPNEQYQIRFCDGSSEAYENFITELEKIMKMNLSAVYYQTSGRVRMVGNFVDGKADGEGIEYYDNEQSSKKYEGEFEDSKYDGSGKFYSESGNIVITANNICNGRPNGICTIQIVNTETGKVTTEKSFNFDEISSQLRINTGSTNFCFQVAKVLFPNIRDIIFESQSISKQLAMVNQRINSLERILLRIEEREKMGFFRRLFNLFF